MFFTQTLHWTITDVFSKSNSFIDWHLFHSDGNISGIHGYIKETKNKKNNWSNISQ